MRALAMVLVVALATLAAATTEAATLCVEVGGAGGCYSTIQDAVDSAGVDDVIQIGAGTFPNPVTVPDNARLSLEGAGVASTTLTGTGATITVAQGARASITDLAISGSGGTGISMGKKARVHAERIEVSGVQRGIWLRKGTRLTLVDSTIRDIISSVGSYHGAIVDPNDLEFVLVTLIGSTIDNVSDAGIRAGAGKVYIEDSQITGCRYGVFAKKVEIVRSTIADHWQQGVLGTKTTLQESLVASNTLEGIRGKRIFLRNSTVSGNGRAGVTTSSKGKVQAVNTTIAGNAEYGLDLEPGTKVKSSNTIVADNTLGACAANTIWISKGYNLVEDTSGCLIAGATATDILGVDPLLAPLADNGGPTFTHAIGVGSAAIDTGAPGAFKPKGFACDPVDQRGVARVAPCDIGAYEAP